MARNEGRPRFPPPWRVIAHDECFAVQDASGFDIVYVRFKDDIIVGTGPEMMTRDQARRIAANIARLPQLVHAVPAERAK